jgi:hypothetical protein
VQEIMTKTLWMVVVGAVLGSLLVGQASTTLLNGLFYTWPTSHVAKGLANDSAGTLTWGGDIDSGVPAGLIGFYVAGGSCPSGWSEYTAARGRYIVTGASTGTAVGTAINSDASENRTAGVHGHTASITASVSDSAHSHSDSADNHGHSNIISASGATSLNADGGAWEPGNTNAAGTGTSLGNRNSNVSATPNLTVTGVSGGVAGTNAPYIRMLVCQKQ